VAWQIQRATFDTSEMRRLLAIGWEPFAVDGNVVYFRRQTL
jgi:hypothetical protein